MRPLSRPLLILAASLSLLACEQKQQQESPPLVQFEVEPSTDTAAVDQRTQDVWQHGISLLDAALVQTRQLREAVQALLQEPNASTLQKAQEAWHRSHNAYLAAELFTALGSSSPSLFGKLGEYDFTLEAWPIQPGYLDYFDVYTFSGIVNDIAMPLSAEALREQHGLTDSADVSLGFHAMEYLLWGEKGARPVDDYAPGRLTPEQAESELREVDLPNNRRRVYLGLLANLLLDDLEAYKTAMEDSGGLMRRSYLALHPSSRVRLFEGAAHAMLSHHRELLQAQLESWIASEGESVLLDLQHTPFAGNSARHLQHSLATLRQVVLNEEEGLGQWLNEAGTEHAEENADLAQGLDRLEAMLADLKDQQQWPPEGEQGAALLSELALLSERFEPRLGKDWQH